MNRYESRLKERLGESFVTFTKLGRFSEIKPGGPFDINGRLRLTNSEVTVDFNLSLGGEDRQDMKVIEETVRALNQSANAYIVIPVPNVFSLHDEYRPKFSLRFKNKK